MAHLQVSSYGTAVAGLECTLALGKRGFDVTLAEAREELARIDEMGGAVAAVDSSYMKQKLVESNTKRLNQID